MSSPGPLLPQQIESQSARAVLLHTLGFMYNCALHSFEADEDERFDNTMLGRFFGACRQ